MFPNISSLWFNLNNFPVHYLNYPLGIKHGNPKPPFQFDMFPIKTGISIVCPFLTCLVYPFPSMMAKLYEYSILKCI